MPKDVREVHNLKFSLQLTIFHQLVRTINFQVFVKIVSKSELLTRIDVPQLFN